MFNNALFLLQLAVIVGFSRLVAAGFRRLAQPQVVGEMAAGIALGPTLFGLLAPGAYHFLFPPASLDYLNALAQAGLALFIYLTGVHVDFHELRRQSGVAIVTSNFSVLVPFVMGIVLASYLFPRYGAGSPVAFSLFIGTAISVTAFPVLARILQERKMLGTRVGVVAIACAAVDDITAWILLASIMGLTHHGGASRPAWLLCLYLAGYAAGAVIVGRILHAWAKSSAAPKNPLVAVPFFLVLAFLFGAAGEWIGIHALAGAFIAGLITPRQFSKTLIGQLEPITLLLPIPVFFALTGIRTNLIFQMGAGAYLDLLLILVIAVSSKWGGTTLVARAKGMTWRDACTLGLMVNTRGLVELVILNVGRESGILSPALFSMRVAMALITTCMTTPLMDWFGVKTPQASKTTAVA